MLNTYLPSEARFYYSRTWFLLLALLPLLTGILASYIMQFSFAGLYTNSPWVITYLTGIVSLVNIFIVTLLTVQVFFREKENGFETVLYAHPLNKPAFLLSRWLLVVGITCLSYFLFTCGWMIGHLLRSHDTIRFGPFQLLNYITPYLTLVVPTIVFCAALVGSVALLTKKPLLVYMAGLGTYILYMVVGLLTDSPLFANASPVSAESMSLAALLDPFGMAGFFEQTQDWTVAERNTNLILPEGNFLINRILYLIFSCGLVWIGINRFKFRLPSDTKKRVAAEEDSSIAKGIPYVPITEKTQALPYWWTTFLIQWKMGMRLVFKSRALLILLLLFGFFLGIEIYSEIEAGIRLPQRYASTTLMVNRISQTLPTFTLIALLFYSQLLLWKSRELKMEALEQSTPLSFGSSLFAVWMVLNSLVLCLVFFSLLIGISFQLGFQYSEINWKLYSTLFVSIAWPAILCAAMVVAIQLATNNKYPGILAAAFFLLITQSKVGRQIGLEHPLTQFAKVNLPHYSDMNGYGAYWQVFLNSMLFWTGVTVLISWLILQWKSKQRKISRWGLMTPIAAILVLSITGWPILQETNHLTKKDRINWQANYEKKYRSYQDLPQPVIRSVTTAIDLFPNENRYSIEGSYQLVNQARKTIDSLLLYLDPMMQADTLQLENATLLEKDKENGHWRYQLNRPLQPGDSLTLQFQLQYSWKAYNQHVSFNAITENGSFMRISRYYPQFGYQAGNELEAEADRKDAGLGAATELKKLEDSSETIQFPTGIVLDAVVSTNSDQQVAGTGQLIKSWTHNKRSYFHFNSQYRIPFRFGFSSARYEVLEETYKGIELIVFYHPTHQENAASLIEESKRTLDYCNKNFSPYPYRSITYAEISGFTSGFNATAYPGTIFMTETGSYHADLRKDKTRDVINELASHELAHEWWGTFQLNPADKEGAQLLTETLAMYTEIMLIKQKQGEGVMKEAVQMFQLFYDRERWTIENEALYKVQPENAALAYYKGAVVMYELYQLIGEEKINTALRKFLETHRYPYAAPTSEDLIAAILAEAPVKHAKKINQLFRE
ncbi:ABC transporter permease/M1 family aminopeptidase [Flavihumibacter sp. UBA7668]|uniref:ABC transporter permease/M1 family aminopeptidase n=1 Tax=Flavihumibacter sp. UBA7668 TaxID=1946542 RepID=UPI0025C6C626|nr:M1 family aminopeptidase [Flavihumibacter sp. UBA7668]